MSRYAGKGFWARAFQAQLKAMARVAARSRVTAKRHSTRAAAGRSRAARAQAGLHSGIALGPTGARAYYVYKPPGVRRSERLPLVVMLHGCDQDAGGFALSTRMNRVAARERFIVLYPQQDRFANAQACWRWYDTRSGRAQGEVGIIMAAIDQVSILEPVDRTRVAIAGLSAGASMAALVASRHPTRFQAVAMHSGISAGLANSVLSGLGAMRGRRTGAPVTPLDTTDRKPALLVIQGTDDAVVAPANGSNAAARWAAAQGAQPGRPRVVRRGNRFPATRTDWRAGRRIVASLCEVQGLGHAWSGGAPGQSYSDPRGPDATRMIWTFIARQFASVDDAAPALRA